MTKQDNTTFFAQGQVNEVKTAEGKSRFSYLSKLRSSKSKSIVKNANCQVLQKILDQCANVDQIEQRKNKRVSFKQQAQTISNSVNDQNDAMEVWTVYSPVTYVTRKEQKQLQKQFAMRAHALRKMCSIMFLPVNCSQPGGKVVQTSSSFLQSTLLRRGKNNTETSKLVSRNDFINAGYGPHYLAFLYFIMSLYPTIPLEVRTPITPLISQSVQILFQGTQLCIFNNVPQMPVCCTAALRLLRNGDNEEGSIAIYNMQSECSLDAHIPLTLLHHIQLGLQQTQIQRYVHADNLIKCRLPLTSQIIRVDYAHSITLHCLLPQKFYISFVTLNESDYEH